MKIAALGLALLAVSGSSCFAECHVERFRFFFGSDTSTTGTVTSGGSCSIRPNTGRGSGLQSVAISGQAQHGVAATNGSIAYPEITYRPKAGYKGPDEFTFALTGGGARLQGTSNVHMTMEVK